MFSGGIKSGHHKIFAGLISNVKTTEVFHYILGLVARESK